MIRSNAAVPAALLLLAALSTLAGCQRSPESSGPTATPPPAEGTGPTASAGQPSGEPLASAAVPAGAPPAEDVPPPEGVLRAYVWECDGGLTLRMKNLYRESAITLEMHEGPRKLPLVVSASGAKYSDGSLTFWTKGGEASLERAGSPPVQCREARAQSLRADARERGVIWRGQGNEPGWLVEIGPGGRMSYVTNFGEQRYDVEATTERGGDEIGVHIYIAETPAGRLKVSVAKEPCADDMSGEAFDHRMGVEPGGNTYRGCATELR
jgi:putative lipoprotein